MDDWLEEYDGQVAVLVSDDGDVGLLFLEVSVRKPIFRRHRTEQIRLEWWVTFSDEEHLQEHPGHYEREADAAELDQDVFRYDGISYSLRWLSPEDGEDVRIELARARNARMGMPRPWPT